jgi:glycosyltransferase involved in cell wall biosynthesis
MKILLVLGFPNPFPGAGWTRIGFLAGNWSRRGHAVDVLGTFSYKSLRKRGVAKNGEINIFNLIFNMSLNHPLIFFTLNSITSLIVSTLFLAAKKPDVVIVSVPTGDVGLGAVMACKLVRAKCVVDYRDEWEDYMISLNSSNIGKSFYSIVKKVTASFYAKSQMVTAVTANFAESLRRRGVVNVRLVPNGADITVFKPLTGKKRNEVFTLFYLGGVGGYYRLDVALRAMKRLEEKGVKNIKLVIAGEGEMQKVLNLARGIGVHKAIEYKGAIDDKAKLAELMAKADIGLVPYDDNPLWKNSIPAKFFEYCACGLPVVATVYMDSILSKLIKEYEIGVTAPPMDQEKLAEAIYSIYENEPFREAAGKRARLLIEEKFDKNKIAAEFLNLVRESSDGKG